MNNHNDAIIHCIVYKRLPLSEPHILSRTDPTLHKVDIVFDIEPVKNRTFSHPNRYTHNNMFSIQTPGTFRETNNIILLGL